MPFSTRFVANNLYLFRSCFMEQHKMLHLILNTCASLLIASLSDNYMRNLIDAFGRGRKSETC